MIRDVYGDLFDADVEAIVNPVNTAGVMGKGLALRFKQRFPENYAVYRQACEAGEVVLGRVLPVSTGQLTNPRWVLNFPTKGHWRSKSRLVDIDHGLVHLRQLIDELAIASIAIPPLGCGLGGLDWSDVAPLIDEHLGTLAADVLVFPPGSPPSRPSHGSRGNHGQDAAEP
jgi:O-acetyl-ADP-ribose deacetylase (regulator of RNase III)